MVSQKESLNKIYGLKCTYIEKKYSCKEVYLA